MKKSFWWSLVLLPVINLVHAQTTGLGPVVPAGICDSFTFNSLRDTAICIGSSVQLNAGYTGPATILSAFQKTFNYPIGFSNHPHNNPYEAGIDVTNVGFNVLTDPLNQIESICLDLETDIAGNIFLFLRSPDGKLLELSTGNGGNGSNYKVTCFSPSETNIIVGNFAPFNGVYRPEGNWNNLTNAQVNGQWTLLVSDGAGVNLYGLLNNWSITFKSPYQPVYAWSNSATLSCNNCPTPLATPSTPTTYIVTVTDNFNCTHLDTVKINFTPFFPAPGGLKVAQMTNNTITWTWDSIPGVSSYLISINGGALEPANGSFSHTVGGVNFGVSLTLAVQAAAGLPNCAPEAALSNAVYNVCELEAVVDSILPAPCSGLPGGSVFISTSDVVYPVFFYPNGGGTVFSTGDITNFFPAGNHFVIVVDNVGCRDTAFFNIGELDTLHLDLTAVPAVCPGGNEGSITAVVNGGQPNYSYSWQRCTGQSVPGNTPSLSGLAAGCYRLTVTDANGCKVTDTVSVAGPPPFVFSFAVDSVSCFGKADGKATITASGGTGPLSFSWSNGASGASVTGLSPGIQPVTITDGLNCKLITLVNIPQPPLLFIDTILATNPSCSDQADGSLLVIAGGGTPSYSYFWMHGPQTDLLTQLPEGPYSVEVVDARGCRAAASANLQAKPAPTLALLPTHPVTCAGECNGEIAIQPGGGKPPYTVKWNNGQLPVDTFIVRNLCSGNYSFTLTDSHGCSQTAQSNIKSAFPLFVSTTATNPACSADSSGTAGVIVFGGTGSYQAVWSNGNSGLFIADLPCGQYQVTVSDSLGCKVNDTVELKCSPPIQILETSVIPVTCFGLNNGMITVQALGGVEPITIRWNDPLQQIGPTASNLLSGWYKVLIQDANGCTTSDSAFIPTPQPVVVQTSSTDVSCIGSTDGTATALPSGGTPPYTFQWSNGKQTPVVTGLPTGFYLVTITDANNCTTVSQPITINQPTTSVKIQAIQQTRIACYGRPDGSATVQAIDGQPPYSFVWSNQQTGSKADSLAAGKYYVTATDQTGCTARDSVEISQLQPIVALLTSKPPSCYNTSDGLAGIISVKGGAGQNNLANYNYAWNLPGIGNSQTADSIPGGRTFQVTVSDLQGCSAVTEFNLTRPDSVKPELHIDTVSCAGETNGRICARPGPNNLPFKQYQWSTGSQADCIDNLPSGAYTVTVTDVNGCTGSVSTQLTEPPPLLLDLQAEPLVCNGDSNGVISTIIQGGMPPFTVAWSDGGSGQARQDLPAGSYSATVTDNHGCTAFAQTLLQQPNAPKIEVQTRLPVCFGADNGRIEVQVTGGQPPFMYSINDGPFQGAATFLRLRAGIYRLRIKDKAGCVSTKLDTLEQPLPLRVIASADTSLLLGDSLVLTADIADATGNVTFSWTASLADYFTCLDSSDCYQLLVHPQQTITYKVTATDDNGCSAEEYIRVKVDKTRGIFVPTAFSPNGHPDNRLLQVHGQSRTVKQIRLFRVYDRWGELLYEASGFKVNQPDLGWDGTFRGRECNPGVYVWYAEVDYLDGYEEALTGNTTLIR